MSDIPLNGFSVSVPKELMDKVSSRLDMKNSEACAYLVDIFSSWDESRKIDYIRKLVSTNSKIVCKSKDMVSVGRITPHNRSVIDLNRLITYTRVNKRTFMFSLLQNSPTICLIGEGNHKYNPNTWNSDEAWGKLIK